MNAAEPKLYDVAVIGAGPGGCSAAISLSARGFSVLLLEKSALPRYKTCGGGLLNRVCRRMPCDISSVVEREFNSISLNLLKPGFHFTATRAQPLVRMTMRAGLDYLLAKEAIRHGTHLVESCHVRQVTPHEPFVEISTASQAFRARLVIGADGVHSIVAKGNGWSPLPCLAPALEWEITVPDALFSRFGGEVRFDFDCVRSGYAWVFPKRNHLSVGILSTGRTNSHLPGQLELYLARLGIGEILKVEKHGHLIPLAPRREPLAQGRLMLVGDAAGLADPVTAEGISYAVQSGQLAAQALIESKGEVFQAGRRYQDLMQREILQDLRAGRWLANLLYHHPHLRNLAFRFHGQRLTNFVASVVAGERGYAQAVGTFSTWLKLLSFGHGRSSH